MESGFSLLRLYSRGVVGRLATARLAPSTARSANGGSLKAELQPAPVRWSSGFPSAGFPSAGLRTGSLCAAQDTRGATEWKHRFGLPPGGVDYGMARSQAPRRLKPPTAPIDSETTPAPPGPSGCMALPPLRPSASLHLRTRLVSGKVSMSSAYDRDDPGFQALGGGTAECRMPNDNYRTFCFVVCGGPFTGAGRRFHSGA